jgi:prepilin-type N-terminal cleavage/methylation domain-containing protein
MDRLNADHRRSGGMTLVELMIAVVLLSIGLLSMIALQVNALRGSQLGRHYTDAAQIARDQIETLQNLDWDDPGMATTDWTAPVVRSLRDIQVDGEPDAVEQSFSVQHRITADAGDDVRLIDVRVTWYEGNDDTGAPPRRRYAMSSSRFDDGG